MSDSHDDSLSRRLSSLETDLAGISLSGPAAARRRAAQRTRHQVTSGVLAGVAAVAVGVFAVSPPDFIASPEPVGPVTDTATPTTIETPGTEEPSPPPAEPSPDPSEGEGPDGGGQSGEGGGGTSSLMVPPGALIDLEYLIRGQESPSDWIEVPAGDSWLPCMPAAGDGAEAIAFEVDDYYRVEHVVEPAGSGAEARIAQLRDEIIACAEGGGDYRLIQEWQVTGVGDETSLLVWQGPPVTDETSTYVEATLVRSGDFVEIVVRGGEGQDYNGVPETDDAVEAVSRLCAVSNTECPSEPEREQLYPEPVGDVPGWLALDDLVESGLDALTDGSDVADSTELGMTDYGFVGLERDPLADGAESLEQRTYSDPLEPGGAQLAQFRTQFPDAESARAHYGALAAAAEQPTQPGDVVENTGAVSGDGYDGTSWRLENTEFGTAWLYGAAVSGNVVTVVYYGLIGDELTPDQMRQLIDLAAQRIGG